MKTAVILMYASWVLALVAPILATKLRYAFFPPVFCMLLAYDVSLPWVDINVSAPPTIVGMPIFLALQVGGFAAVIFGLKRLIQWVRRKLNSNST